MIFPIRISGKMEHLKCKLSLELGPLRSPDEMSASSVEETSPRIQRMSSVAVLEGRGVEVAPNGVRLLPQVQ